MTATGGGVTGTLLHPLIRCGFGRARQSGRGSAIAGEGRIDDMGRRRALLPGRVVLPDREQALRRHGAASADLAAAEKYWRKALAIDPDNYFAQHNLERLQRIQ